MTSVRLRGACLLVLVGVLAAGCGGHAQGRGTSGAPRPDGRLVLVSGRDDHGLLATEQVPVYADPGSGRRVGSVRDGTLARVSRIRGSWLHVATAEGRPVQGWVDDFFLRGVVHLVGPVPTCRASLDGRRVTAGLQVVVRGVRGREVLVESASDPQLRGWAPRDAVQELGPQGADCAADPPDSAHR